MCIRDSACIWKQNQAKDNRIHTNDKWEEAYEKYKRRMKEIRKNPAGRCVYETAL